MLEVIEALAKTEDKKLADILKIKEEKKLKRGGFEKRFFLLKPIQKTNLKLISFFNTLYF